MPTYRIHDFLTQLRSAGTGSDTWQIIENYFSTLGFNVVNFGFMSKTTGELHGLLSNMDQSFMSHYMSEGYARHDPFTDWAMNNTTPLIYSRDELSNLQIAANSKAMQFLDDAAEYGIRSSVLLPYHQTQFDFVTGFNLAVDAQRPEFCKFMRQSMEEIQISATIAQCYLPKLIDGPDDFPALYLLTDIKSRLSGRETEVLKWLCAGYRNDRVAEKMGIAGVTVNFHIASIKKKLNAKTREEAIAIALSSHLLG